ncbi:proton-conducting membrane transporter [Natronomonas salsuginis]|jgi:NADH-quinone oxidoreductase subunit J|uniref:Proton-conducting membrane transporter n=1 Tax=Natronomonas salsuginis TaxID=2217661 RepID=A0A4U5JAR6_9EURY|nr:proton-conducting membrane transporter [Natronomonas salsuginis]TKR25361.1 proton-conducting membrane transporter [Natronomonas salsuginis]
MTTRPRLHRGEMVIGVIAVALFAFLSAVFLTAGFGTAGAFPEGSVTRSIGYAMFNLPGADIDSEGFLVAFITIAILLDAALDGAVMLARREDDS